MRWKNAWQHVAELVVALGLLGGTEAWAQQAAPEKADAPKAAAAVSPAAAPAAKAAAPAKANAFRGRLPAYYAQVIDDQQRQTIYQIQVSYHDQLSALKAQLEALTKERDEKVAAVLNAEQHKKIEELKSVAKEKHLAKQEENEN